MAMARPDWVDALDDNFRAIYNETEERTLPTMMFDKIFNVMNSTKAFEKDTSLSGIGLLEEVNELGNIPFEDIAPGWDTTYVHRKFGKGRMVSQEMIDDEKWNIIPKLPKTLSDAKNRTVETTAADVLNFGFVAGGGGMAPFAGGDGQPLFSTAHTNRAGNVVQSNKITAPLSDVSLASVITAMKTRKDIKGQIITFQPDTLIVPSALEFTARRILETTGQLGGNNNDINVVKGALNLVVWPFLTSSTAWFVADSKAHELNFFWRKNQGVRGPIWNEENESAKWLLSIRFSVGFSDWMGIYGSTGDAS